MFTFEFTLTFMSTNLFEFLTWIPFMLGKWNLVCYLPRRKSSTLWVAPRPCLGVRLGVKKYESSEYHNICFHAEIRKKITDTFSYLELYGLYFRVLTWPRALSWLWLIKELMIKFREKPTHLPLLLLPFQTKGCYSHMRKYQFSSDSAQGK